MADRHRFETEADKLQGALGALLSRGVDEGNCPDSFQEYCLLSLLHDQAKLVHRIGIELLFPARNS